MNIITVSFAPCIRVAASTNPACSLNLRNPIRPICLGFEEDEYQKKPDKKPGYQAQTFEYRPKFITPHALLYQESVGLPGHQVQVAKFEFSLKYVHVESLDL